MRRPVEDTDRCGEGEALQGGIFVQVDHNSHLGNRETVKCSASRLPRRGVNWISLLGIWVLLVGTVGGRESDDLRIRVEVAPGIHFVGQAMEVIVGVVGADQRPEVDPPSIAGAEIWPIDNGLKPLSISGIGGTMSESNLFVSRFCVVPRRSGPLEIPAIRARLREQSGRSRPFRLTIRPVPVEGRPAEFLGGVGRFALEATAEPKVLRVGQELEYRITVSGQAAWGMVDRPKLKRFDGLPIGLRIEPKPTDLATNPPARRFFYRLRPSRPGEAVLPPVAIASFDPASSRYITQVTPGVAVRVVAVPTFDQAGFDPGEPGATSRNTNVSMWTAWIGSTVLLIGVAIGLVRVRRRTKDRRLHGPAAARRYAARLARSTPFDPPDRKPRCDAARSDTRARSQLGPDPVPGDRRGTPPRCTHAGGSAAGCRELHRLRRARSTGGTACRSVRWDALS